MRRLGGMGALAIAAALLASCAPATDRALTAPAAALQEDRVEWAFTQADQHPERKLVAVIEAAESSLDIAIYSLTYPDVVKAIRDAAKRGVNVRLIADRIQSGGKTQKEALKLLGSAGVPIKVNRHSGLMHLKMTIADGKVATTGSFNYSKAASTTNDEIFVEFRDEEIARSFAEQFEAMWSDEERFEPLDAAVAMDESSSAAEAGEEAGEGSGEAPGEDGNVTGMDGDIAGNGAGKDGDAPDSSLAPCAAPEIKGNVNSAGDKIYHVPGSAQYDRTKAEEMFCTEADATAAGFRKAKQ